MGTFYHTIEIGDPQGANFEPMEALVDTGASYTAVPGSILKRLGVTAHDRVTFILADGRRVERDIGQTWVRIDSKAVITLVVFGDEGTGQLLGAYTLEGLRLSVDPLNQRLVPIPGLLMALSNPTGQYASAGRELLEKAQKELAIGDLRQASEKGWAPPPRWSRR